MGEYQPKKQIILVANGEPPSPNLLYSALTPRTSLIAVDGGFNTCQTYQRLPELVLGDFDSTEERVVNNFPTIQTRFLPDQTKSDLEKALEFLFEFSPEQIVVLGALGRRLDHTYKNLEQLSRYPQKVLFYTAHEHLFALPKKGKLTCGEGKTLSLIPFGGRVTNLLTSGLKWEVKGKDLTHTSLSNVTTSDKISIEYETGHLLCSLVMT